MKDNNKSDKIDYSKLSQFQLIKKIEEQDKEIQKLKEEKKYGLIWDEERTKEVFEQKVQDKLPVLKEVVKNEIRDVDKLKPNNILIEGDNYHALSVLNYTHKGKIDVIYIDPPYNTGNGDFRYNDRWVDLEDSYKHSKWINFMIKRLKLAHKLLKKDGIIFISIDDNELSQLKMLCDELVFGEKNMIACVTWRQLHTVKNNARHFSRSTEYVLIYAKNKKYVKKIRQPMDKTDSYPLNDNDGKGAYKLDPISARNKNIEYKFYFKKWNLRWRAPIGSYPRYSKKTLAKMNKNDEIVYSKNWKDPKAKRYLNKVQQGVPPSTFWDGKEVGFNKDATMELGKILSRDSFISPKPISLIKHCLEIGLYGKNTGIILDFFAGSGTTGHATLQLNKEDNGNRKFILCTDNENNICRNICYPRLKKVIRGYRNPKGEKVEGLGGNLKYFKTAFIDLKKTEFAKKKISDSSTEMLCIKENCFEKVNKTRTYAIFKNCEKYLGVAYDRNGMNELKSKAKKIDKSFTVYIFSLDRDAELDTFDGMQNITIKSIPKGILDTHRLIYH